ncbi:GumC family protein [Aurantiacibacter gilvus]|uniref:Polysaccharide chain length determinant N-terminal domain-containing protein n=1 Tax=Aurantiacibacter gilvus TaxID=3139141 RepID=A0ABU9IDF4_9SPHN
MTGTYDEADYLSPAPRGQRQRPAWVRLGLPVAGIVLVCGGVAAAIGLTTEKIYEAEARVELIVPEGADRAAMPTDSERLVVVRSSAVAGTAVEALDLLDDPRFLDANPALDTGGGAPDERQTRAAAVLLRNSRATLDDNGVFVSVTYRSASPTLAADIADAMAAAFVEADARTVAGALGDSREELEALVAEVRGELEAAERALSGDMTEADILALPASEANLLAGGAGIDPLTEDARLAIATQIALVRGELARVEAQIAAGTLDERDPVVRDLLESRDELQAEYERVTSQFREDYPAARELREQLDSINANLARERGRMAGDLAEEQRQLTRQEEDLLAQLAELGGAISSRGEAGEGIVDLQADVLAKRQLYDMLLARLAVAETGERPTTARVISPAELPTMPVSPNWYWLTGGALGAALLLSLLVVANDYRRRKGR